MTLKRKKQKPRQVASDSICTTKSPYSPTGILRLAIFAVISLLFVAGPYFRGLYFAQELLVVHLISFTLFSIWWVVKLLEKGDGHPVAFLDICIVVLGLLYFASRLWAINPREAVGEFLKITNYLVVYLLVFDLSRHLKLKRFFPRLGRECGQSKDLHASLLMLLTAMVLSGVALACSGLAAVGGADIAGAFVWGRLFSPLQYANAAAIYFLTSMILAVGLMMGCGNRHLRTFYFLSAALLFISIILTYSRSVWLLIPPLVLLFAAVAGRGYRLRILLYFTAIFFTGVPASFAAYRFFQAGDRLAAWGFIAAALVLALLLRVPVELYLRRFSRVGKAAAAGAVLLALSVAGFLWLQGELRRPLHLERTGEQPSEEQYFEQIISGVPGGSFHRLSLEVKAAAPPGENGGEEAFAWKLAVQGIVADRFSNEYLDVDILEYSDPDGCGWQKREFEFKTPQNIRRLNIRLISGSPGVGVTFRNVALHGPAGDKALHFYAYRILPAELYERIMLFRLDLTEEPRIAHYRDAWKIIRNNPLWGYGGGAWNCLYPAYMTKSYWTAEPHNHYLKVWIEAGLFAFLAFVGMAAALTVSLLKFIRRNRGAAVQRLTGAALYAAAAGLMIHGAVDFSLSLGAVSLLLFALLGIARSLFAGGEPGGRKQGLPFGETPAGRGMAIAGLAVSLLLLGYTCALWQGNRASAAALSAYDRKSYTRAEVLLSRAIKFDPLQAVNYALLADIYKSRAAAAANHDEAVDLMAKALELARRAWEKEPYNTSYNRQYGLIMLNTGEIEAGLQRLERNIALNPFHPDHYAQLAAARLAVAEYHLKAGASRQAELLLRQILALETQMGRYHEDTAGLDRYLEEARRLLQELERAAHRD